MRSGACASLLTRIGTPALTSRSRWRMPGKNRPCSAYALVFSCIAIMAGADAVYIGAPAFGARAAATNSVESIRSDGKSSVDYRVYHRLDAALVERAVLDTGVEVRADAYTILNKISAILENS